MTAVTPLDTVRLRLAGVWLGGCAGILTLVVMQSLLGKFGDRTQDAWGWLLPTVMPTLGMIIAGLTITALEPVRSESVVRTSYYHVALWLSVFYLLLVLLTILIQPFTASDPVDLMRRSNLWLGPSQGLVGSALGVLFASKQLKAL
jgi:hypothetical protein